jgi:hypothetical protein
MSGNERSCYLILAALMACVLRLCVTFGIVYNILHPLTDWSLGAIFGIAFTLSWIPLPIKKGRGER